MTHSVGIWFGMTRMLHGSYDSSEYPYKSYMTHAYLCYSHVVPLTCMFSHVSVSTRMSSSYAIVLFSQIIVTTYSYLILVLIKFL